MKVLLVPSVIRIAICIAALQSCSIILDYIIDTYRVSGNADWFIFNVIILDHYLC